MGTTALQSKQSNSEVHQALSLLEDAWDWEKKRTFCIYVVTCLLCVSIVESHWYSLLTLAEGTGVCVLCYVVCLSISHESWPPQQWLCRRRGSAAGQECSDDVLLRVLQTPPTEHTQSSRKHTQLKWDFTLLERSQQLTLSHVDQGLCEELWRSLFGTELRFQVYSSFVKLFLTGSPQPPRGTVFAPPLSSMSLCRILHDTLQLWSPVLWSVHGPLQLGLFVWEGDREEKMVWL